MQFDAAVRDADVHARVIAAMASHAVASGDKAIGRDALVAQAAADGPQALTDAQRHRPLVDAFALRALRERGLLHQAHPAWWQAAERRDPAHAEARAAGSWREAQPAVVDT